MNTNINNGKLIIISGPAGSGKSTVLKELFKYPGYKYSVSATTRKPRETEIDGRDYYFLTREEFFKKISDGEILEHIEYSGNYYGTPREPVEKMLEEKYNVILEIDVIGALNIKEKFPGAVMIFLSPPTFAEEESRLRSRATESEEFILKRLARGKQEVEYIYKYDYLVLNQTDMQEITAYNINCIAEAEKYRMNEKKASEFLKSFFN
ncbi:MAG: guanylate kinase [Oscillospiraceae bacterium]|nr:guanylate kinase [Oscillospiraceae bacterium]